MLDLSNNWLSLVKPKKILIERNEDNNNIAKVIVSPLESGFGTTIGNSLRRILLSYIQGSAVTGVKISSVVHQFSVIQGVKEDVLSISMNLKLLIIKINSNDSKKLIKLKIEGPKVVTGKTIAEFATSDLEILNTDHYICTVNEEVSIEMEIICEKGRGYVPEEELENKDDKTVDTIRIGALFSPVRNVAFRVENTRVGNITNYDKLIIDIETNGVITPDFAIAIAAKILQNHLDLFIAFDSESEKDIEQRKNKLPFDPILLKKVDELELSVRAFNCLKNANIIYIGDLVKMNEDTMLATPNFGRKSLSEIKEILSNIGLSLEMNIEGWPPKNIEELSKKYLYE